MDNVTFEDFSKIDFRVGTIIAVETFDEAMTLKYPITIDEMANIHGVGEGKANKYGKEFIDVISKYIQENNITRFDDFIVKTSGSKSALKLYIIQCIDRKMGFDDIISAKGLEMDDFVKEMESIVYSGTKGFLLA